MRYNRWIRAEARQDINRICSNHPEMAELIRRLTAWVVDQLAENPGEKGAARFSPDGKVTYLRWTVGPIVVIFRLLPDADQTVIVEGFLPNH
jgi:hypothetical protein